MKKLAGIFVVATAVFMLNSCGNKFATTASLITQLDSLNYAFGVANGTYFRGMFAPDDTTKDNFNAMLKGFNNGFRHVADAQVDKAEAITAGIQFNEGIKSGFLFGDSTLTANRELIIATAEKVLLKDSTIGMDAMQAQQYYFKIYQLRHDTLPHTITQTMLDSLSIAHAVMQMSRNLTLVNDSTRANFVKYFKEGLKQTKSTQKFENIGFTIATNGYEMMKKNGLMNDSVLKLNDKVLLAGINAGVLRDTTYFTPEKAGEYLNKYQQKRQLENAEKEFGANRIDGEKFLETNKIRPNVKTTASGLQYEIIKEGKGQKPAQTDRVKVNYTGSLIDGTIFDTSKNSKEPVILGLNQVIKGWQEGLQLMPVGSKYKFYIPQELAYGVQGRKDRMTGQYSIKPFSALVFEVEVLTIEQPVQQPQFQITQQK
jgi:FKBP-type peptidyl-prolyl cis-trans isomerase FklB